MVFIFEDKREKGIPTLFRRGCPDLDTDGVKRIDIEDNKFKGR